MTTDMPVTNTMANGYPHQPATVLGANLFRELRDHSYRVGMTSWQSLAIAMYWTEKYPHYPINVALNRWYDIKTEWLMGLMDRTSRASFWNDYYAKQSNTRWNS